MIDHSLLDLALNDGIMKEGCVLYKKYNFASVCIKSYAEKMAAGLLNGSSVLVETAIVFALGNSATNVKAFKTQQAIADGVEEIDMVVNIDKLLGEDWDNVENDIERINHACKVGGAILKVDLFPTLMGIVGDEQTNNLQVYMP